MAEELKVAEQSNLKLPEEKLDLKYKEEKELKYKPISVKNP